MSNEPKSEIKWMYDGPKSMVNAEEYLTGRKIDKNFELYNSDFKEAPSSIDRVITKSDNVDTSSSTTLLNLETIKKEDPLIAIKVKEQQIRREIFENPLKMKRLQTIVMAEMAKKMKKFAGGSSRRRRSNSSSSSSSSSSSEAKKRKKTHNKDTKSTDHHRRKVDEFRNSSKQHSHRQTSNKSSHRHRSEQHVSEKKAEKQHEKSEHHHASESRKRHDSDDDSSPSSNDDHQRSSSKKYKSAEYGLIHVSSKPSSSSSSAMNASRTKPSESTGRSKAVPNTRHDVNDAKHSITTARRKLTEKEMEAKRLEMMDNAKWRDDQRRKNLETYQKMDEEEKRQADARKAADFIRPMVSDAFDKSSVEDRVKSKRHSLQRRHNAMDSNFARK